MNFVTWLELVTAVAVGYCVAMYGILVVSSVVKTILVRRNQKVLDRFLATYRTEGDDPQVTDEAQVLTKEDFEAALRMGHEAEASVRLDGETQVVDP